ncbi:MULTISPECIES: DUF3087 domain-containing protein [Oceanimonas]|uniref:DUF3087 domain-containing protein n=1 Tax=Oceanimonas doudoroffii TaxID=84158 RepID=A0A233RHL7_9GAMM|nr:MULTISPECIES: DUF3087 domain-containing protein [Oceanimonas]NHI00522.1 hypothetical protein [Oceanimonas sp. MB9]OXY82874.1 hypothetical protein B6S08_05045 [Oceanimonas doudoroffii]
MTLQDIDKSRYRRHLNRVFIGSALALAAFSLGISQLLIALFPDPDGSHFHWNLLGVVAGALLVGAGLSRLRRHPFMTEVVYVWELKQRLNKISRKRRQVEAAAQQGDETAMQVLQFSYAGSRQLWLLDDNTLVMDELAARQTELNNLAQAHGVTLDAERYDESMLERF